MKRIFRDLLLLCWLPVMCRSKVLLLSEPVAFDDAAVNHGQPNWHGQSKIMFVRFFDISCSKDNSNLSDMCLVVFE